MTTGTVAIALRTCRVTDVRMVTSRAGRPPATNAWARGWASSTRSITSTGMTGASSMISSTVRVMLSLPKCRSRAEQADFLMNGQPNGDCAHKAFEAPLGREPAMKTTVRQMIAHALGQSARQYDGVGSMRERQIARRSEEHTSEL